jgi:hypothetical protein
VQGTRIEHGSSSQREWRGTASLGAGGGALGSGSSNVLLPAELSALPYELLRVGEL